LNQPPIKINIYINYNQIARSIISTMAKTQRRRKMSCRRNKSRSLKGGTKASSKSHVASADSLAVIRRVGESSADHMKRVLARVSEIAKSAVPNGIAKVQKTLNEEERALIAMQRKINARDAEKSASYARPKHGDSSHAAHLRAAYAAAAARGTGNPQ
jgi:hypothetical protein